MRSGRNSMGLQETPWSILAISPDKIPVKSKRGLGGRRQVWAIRKVLDATLAQSFGLRLLTPLPPPGTEGARPSAQGQAARASPGSSSKK